MSLDVWRTKKFNTSITIDKRVKPRAIEKKTMAPILADFHVCETPVAKLAEFFGIIPVIISPARRTSFEKN